MRVHLGIGLLLLALAGCGKQVNAEYCQQALHQSEAFCRQNYPDAGVDAAVTCTMAMDPTCVQPTPLCDLSGSSGVCVQCIPGVNEMECMGTKPICEPQIRACRGCITNAECPTSGLCLPTGACADASNIALATPTGAATAPSGCNPTPCTMIEALKTTKSIIKATGAFTDPVSINNVGPKTIYGVPGMTSFTRTTNGPILEVKGTSTIDVWDVEILNGVGAANDGAVQLTSGTPTLGLHRMNIHGASLTSPSPMYGVVVAAGTLVMERSTVANYAAGGILVSAATSFDIRNNFIGHNGLAGNGSNGTAVGGANLATPTMASHFAWNTLAFNGSGNGSTVAGIECAAAGIDGAGNLLLHNVKGNSAQTQTSGCGFLNNLEVADDAANLGFKSPDTSDFHLAPTSTRVIDQGGKQCPAYDIDGESRPFPTSGNCDYGADEFH